MVMVTWLADALRGGGLSVGELDGWKTRGHGPMSGVLGVLGHHTAGPATGNSPSFTTIVNGRPGLPGPLANLYLDRSGHWTTVAAGLAYHAGTGVLPWCPRDLGNNYLIGIEAESAGTGDWTAEQLDSYPRGVAALLKPLGLGADRFAGHLEYAPTRKIDPAGWPGGMNGFRATVAQDLRPGSPAPLPKPAPKPHQREDTMYIKCGQSPTQVAILSGPIFVSLFSPGELQAAEDAIVRQGAVVQWVEQSTFDELAKASAGLCANPRQVTVVTPPTKASAS